MHVYENRSPYHSTREGFLLQPEMATPSRSADSGSVPKYADISLSTTHVDFTISQLSVKNSKIGQNGLVHSKARAPGAARSGE